MEMLVGRLFTIGSLAVMVRAIYGVHGGGLGGFDISSAFI